MHLFDLDVMEKQLHRVVRNRWSWIALVAVAVTGGVLMLRLLRARRRGRTTDDSHDALLDLLGRERSFDAFDVGDPDEVIGERVLMREEEDVVFAPFSP